MRIGKENFKNKIGWCFDNTYISLPEIMLSRLPPVSVKSPKLVILNKELAEKLDLNLSSLNNGELADIFSGNLLPEGSESIAQAYAGHQFGHFTILGDGRAIIIGEHLTKNKKRFDIQFKGSGLTPYSRDADGRAALSPMLREYIISESMHALNIPTTRSLAVVRTGEDVIRETDTLDTFVVVSVLNANINLNVNIVLEFQVSGLNSQDSSGVKSDSEITALPRIPRTIFSNLSFNVSNIFLQ